MPDIVNSETRSRMMAGIRGKNTRPELAVRRALHALGYRYRLHAGNLPGKPDLVLPRHGAVIFVHGCFWHGHGCALFRLPSTRPEFWEEKISVNRARDSNTDSALQALGWRRLTIRECALKGSRRIGIEKVASLADRWLSSDKPALEIRGTV